MSYPAPVALLDFALALVAAADVTTLRSWEKSQLRDRLAQALGEDRPGVTGMRAGILVSSRFDGPGPKRYPDDALQVLRDDVAKVLRTVAHKTRVEGVEIERLRFLTLPYDGQQVFRVAGTVRDTFLFVLFSAIRLIEKPLVLPCSHCATLFRTEHKRQYCSPQCANRASMDAWKSRQSESGGRSRKKRKTTRAKTS